MEPLTNEQRGALADIADKKAAQHLKDAKAIAAWQGAPNACVHAAYYAMHFAAVAALYRAGGIGKRKDVPESHEHVLQHFSKYAETLSPSLKDSGKTLNRARDMRMEADYFGDIHNISAKDASELTQIAEDFLAQWKTS